MAYNYYNYNGNRQFFVPFLLGGLTGSALVGLSRPRPIYNVAPVNPISYPPIGPYYYNSYGGFIPYYR